MKLSHDQSMRNSVSYSITMTFTFALNAYEGWSQWLGCYGFSFSKQTIYSLFEDDRKAKTVYFEKDIPLFPPGNDKVCNV